MTTRSHRYNRFFNKPLETINKRFTFAEIAGVLGTIILLGAAGTAAGIAISDSAKADTKQKEAQSDLLGAKPKTPDPNAAATQATDILTQNRRTLLASGGNTDVTGGAPILTGNTKSNTILGG